MDPDANLEEQRELVKRINNALVTLDPDTYERLAELVEALDQWLSNGGFLPRDWRRGRPATREEVEEAERAVNDELQDTFGERLIAAGRKADG